jgi:hypothetical protein
VIIRPARGTKLVMGAISSNTMRTQRGNLVVVLYRLVIVIFLPALAINMSVVASVYAFHNDSSFSCYGCHNEKGPSDHIYNLIGKDQSSTCLRCHQRKDALDQGDHYICTSDDNMPPGVPPAELTPGGDFGWLKKDYFWREESGGTGYSSGEEHGHNIVAADFGYSASVTYPTAPGGIYPSSALHCSSCHDPHGTYRRNSDGSVTAEGLPIAASGSYNDSPDPGSSSSVGVYRMLAGINYQPRSLIDDGVVFTKDPPVAVSPRSYNRSEVLTQTRVAYGAGMSEWCLNCHTNYDPMKNHPAGNTTKITAQMAKLYNSYLPGDSESNSYLSLTPFEVGSSDYSLLKKLAVTDNSQLEGPVNAYVSCLSCHRAHASGWDHGLRFNLNAHLTTVADGKVAYPDLSKHPAYAQGRTPAEIRKAYYDREATIFGALKRNLCSKCHAKE